MFAAASPDITALAKLDVEGLILPVLVQLAVIIAVARAAGALARRVGQPTAVGEIVAGLLLGPSLFGWVAPEWSAMLFKPVLHGVSPELSAAAFPKVFQAFAQVGLVFLLFLIGLEFEFAHLRTTGPAAVAVSAAGVALPFALGVGLAVAAYDHIPLRDGESLKPLVQVALFMGVSMSITAIPILGRMLIELGVNRTKLAAVVITAAAVDDAAGWILLATVATVARTGFDPALTAVMAAETLGFLAVMVFVVRPVLVRYLRYAMGDAEDASLTVLAVVLVALLVCAVVTNLIGIFAIFGAFLLGAVLSDQHHFRAAVGGRMRDFVTAFFLPIFFTYTGLRTEVSTLSGGAAWLIFGGVMLAAVGGKFGGGALAARLTGMPWRESALVGALMNTRALMELIVINVGYDLGVIPKSLFAMLVLMAIITTVMTTPIVLLLRKGTEFEAPIAASGFLRRPRPSAVAS